MSMLVHKCRRCGHRAMDHDDGGCCHRCCRQNCNRSLMDLDPNPVLVPTFDDDAVEVPTVHSPGTTWNAGNRHAAVLCICAACIAAYEHLTKNVPATTRRRATGTTTKGKTA